MTEGQTWAAAAYAANAGFVPARGADVLTLLDPRPGERILDLGCGDGVLTARLAASGAAVTGLDPAPDLAAAARARGVTVLERDAHDPIPGGPWDAVFSNAALHWMHDPETVLANVLAALRPGGRFVAEQGGFGNVAAVVTALNAARAAAGLAPVRPWDFPSPARARRRLVAAGFVVAQIALIPRLTPLPTGMAGWIETFGGAFAAGLDADARAGLFAHAVALLPALHDPDEGWIADYVRLRFVAHRPG
ncbi:MAG: class I SAM-dependent methyltransferase [Gemmobacter sp.]